jgi:acyl carrier protein
LCCYYIAERQIDEIIFKNALNDDLPSYMHPVFFVHISKFPLNINGKIDRKALPNPTLKHDDMDDECRGQLELKIENIWKEILKIEKIGRQTSFFSIGGSSLKAIQIISKLQKEFNVLIKLADFFTHPTIMDVAKKIGQVGLVEQADEGNGVADKV